MHGFIGELVGTFILIVIGCGVGAGLNLKKTFSSGQKDWFYIAFAWGVAVTMGVYVAGSLGSQGHLNPAVTIAFAVAGTFPTAQVGPYLAGQFLGAFLGSVVVIIQFWPHFKATTRPEENNVSIFATMPGINYGLFNFISELIATFVFILVLVNLGDFTTGLKPVVVGLVIFAIGAGLGTTTGFALNPARDWGPRLAYTLIPVPNKSGAGWWYSWVPMVGPICGGLLAVGLQAMVK
ncbi:MIP/aquaporin family protein [uncultured Limosilactobacillus sp.]|uniref:MIP/aquaporin family protein n=1 Tax=uncultured Limosilactobacillus sp. TaxID=2837629 RepID=UPI0025EBF866|nr:MIP/aquaporin family protein [uncultured Limosilactobacillus sp.]